MKTQHKQYYETFEENQIVKYEGVFYCDDDILYLHYTLKGMI